MDNIQQTLTDFGKTLEVDGLAFNENQVVHFNIETVGDLYIQANPEAEEILIYLLKEIPFASKDVYQKALSLGHYQEKNPYPVYVALLGEKGLIFAISLTSSQCDLPSLQTAIEHLTKLHERIANF